MPEEVVEEILLRLPADSLVRFKCVCKSWYALINDPSFVHKHLIRLKIENSKSSSSISLFLSRNRQELSLDEIFDFEEGEESWWFGHRDQVLSLITIRNDGDHNGDRLSCTIEELDLPLIPNPENVNRSSRIFNGFHCNGIIFLADEREKTFVLCNPTLKELEFVPLPPDFCNFRPRGCGFGYDCRANEYKYVRLLRCCDNREVSKVSKAHVYTLGTNSWREIEIDIPIKHWSDRRKGVYCKGVYYWWNAPGFYIMCTILSFDMCKEKFKSIPIPSVQLSFEDSKDIVVWNDSIALFFSRENSWFSTSFEMWVMVDDFGAVQGCTSWTKLLTIGPLACIHSPLAFWTEDELLMESRDGLIVSYNLYTQKLRRLPIPGAVFPGKSYADFYVKSLVSVKRRNTLSR